MRLRVGREMRHPIKGVRHFLRGMRHRVELMQARTDAMRHYESQLLQLERVASQMGRALARRKQLSSAPIRATSRRSSAPQSSGAQWLNPLDLRLDGPSCLPKVYRALCVEPELGRVTEQTREPEGHLRTHPPPLSKHLVDRLARYPQSPGETGYCKPVIRQEI